MKVRLVQGQKFLTSVAVVRMRKNGERFEIACWPNKVIPWRDGEIADLEQVLVKRDEVYVSIINGKLANRALLEKAWPGVDVADVVLDILRRGEIQTTLAERKEERDSMMLDIATIVADKCVNTDTQRPFTIEFIETAMREQLHYNLHPTKGAKPQAVSVIVLLHDAGVPIVRAKMRIHVAGLTQKAAKKLGSQLLDLFSTVEAEHWVDGYQVTGLIDPGNFAPIERLVLTESKGEARVDVQGFIAKVAKPVVDDEPVDDEPDAGTTPDAAAPAAAASADASTGADATATTESAGASSAPASKAATRGPMTKEQLKKLHQKGKKAPKPKKKVPARQRDDDDDDDKVDEDDISL
jgi:ribosome maturation protein SDO1